MRRWATLLLAVAPVVFGAERATERLQDTADVFRDIMATPDKGIPRDLIEKSRCIVIVPGLKKGAFVVGVELGKGFISCREANGNWSAPGAVRVEGGSVGFQIGGSDTDVVMLVMNNRGAEKLLRSQFTLGAEGEIAAGPVGRDASAETDAEMRAEILSWSRTHGVFAGLALKGATLRTDEDANAELYGRKMDNKQIVDSRMAPPPAAGRLIEMLSRYPQHV
ncbi:MAG TPA: lipid-binding SYLF domain-containing protein [Verrucomicrobiae bacterium]|nr:lipid-binding SYLF domain-containing protein [Verrucomicrobiae bacterium]